MNKTLKILFTLIGTIIITPILLVLWLTAKDFRPKPISEAEFFQKNEISAPLNLTIFNWNIGYGGLGEDMDFFLDGGQQIRPSKEEYTRYIDGILDTIKENSADFYFVQEIDRKSTRSYKEDQYLSITQILNNYNSSFATNYKVNYIPSPHLVGKQLGSVYSGLAVFSKYTIKDSQRVSLPGEYTWPKKLFFLDRCMLVSEIDCKNGKNIYLINTHNSAYDKGGFQKKEQLKFIGEYALKLYEKGDYVIIGGDWNNYIPGTDEFSFPSTEKAPPFYQPLPDDWIMENWNWAADKTTATNRSLKASYNRGETFTSIIDGFLLSPNIKMNSVKTLDSEFQFSDHNPLLLNIQLN